MTTRHSWIDGIWTPVRELLEMVRDEVTGAQLDDLLKRTPDIEERLRRGRARKPLLAPVVVPNQGTPTETFHYGRQLLRVGGDAYNEAEYYSDGVAISPIPEGQPFEPGKVTLRIVDFGAHAPMWRLADARIGLEELQEAEKTIRAIQGLQAGDLASLEPLFAAIQHPRWMHRQKPGFGPMTSVMLDEYVPTPVMGGLLVEVAGIGTCTPCVQRLDGNQVFLCAYRVSDCALAMSLPTLMTDSFGLGGII